MRLQDLCDLCAEFFFGSVCAPDKATLKAENHALQCATAGPYNAAPCNLLGVGSTCGLGPDLVCIHSISLAARYRVAACSTTLSQGLDEIQTAPGRNCTPFFLLFLPFGRKNSLLPPWPLAPRTLLIVFVAWTVMANLMKFRRIRSRKLLLDNFLTNPHEQDFAWPFSRRASEVLGPISRYRVADILLHMKLVSRASRPGLTVGILRIHCYGLCTALRFHTEEHDHTCRVGCPNEPDSLSHYNECHQLYNIFTSFLEIGHCTCTEKSFPT